MIDAPNSNFFINLFNCFVDDENIFSESISTNEVVLSYYHVTLMIDHFNTVLISN